MNKSSQESDTGLGNHMFQYAICRAVAEKNFFNFYITYDEYLRRVFPNIEVGIRDGDTKYNYIEDVMNQTYKSDIFYVADYTHLSGYFQTEQYFKNIENNVKKWFEIESDEQTAAIKNKYNVEKYCYIHIRGGANRTNGQNWLLPREYYLKGIDELRKIKNDIQFFIITDDLEFAHEILPEFEIISNTVEIDFKLLYFSQYLIMSASTFSWWAAWLSEKKMTIAPSYWLNYNNPSKGFYPQDIKTEKFKYI